MDFGAIYTVQKGYRFFPSPAGMWLTNLSLAGNNLIIPGQGEFGLWHPGWDGKMDNLLVQCRHLKNLLHLASAIHHCFTAYHLFSAMPIAHLFDWK